VRTEPAAIEPTEAPGDEQEERRTTEDRQESTEEEVERRVADAGLTGEEGVDPERPMLSEQDRVAQRQIDAEQVERRGQEKEREEPDLEPGRRRCKAVLDMASGSRAPRW
jgi:hypothetical protein